MNFNPQRNRGSAAKDTSARSVCEGEFAEKHSLAYAAGFHLKLMLRLTTHQRISPTGGVLIVVLVVVSLLTLAILSFSQLTFTENVATKLVTRQAQARAFADSGVELIQRYMTLPAETREESGGHLDNPTRFQGQLVMDSPIARNRGRFAVISTKIESGELKGARFGVEDESSKLNLNTLMFAEKQRKGSGRTLLMALPGMTEDIADAILDYIDEDSDQRELGAESDFYTSLTPAYACKNGPLETVDELLLVKGVTPELFYGADTNRNGMIDTTEQNNPKLSESGDAPPEADRGWSAYVTLYSVEANLKPDGTMRINLNGEDMQVLFDDVSTVMNEKYATFIVAYRQYGPYTGNQAGMQQSTVQLDFTKKAKTKLTTILDLIGAKVQVTNNTTGGGSSSGSSGGSGQSGGGSGNQSSSRGQSGGVILDSPFANEPGLMGTYLPLLLDNTTTNTAPSIPGRININQASSVVLKGIPGMDAQMVETIEGARDINSSIGNPAQKYETWLLQQGIVTLPEMKALMPFICGGGSVYRAQVVGYFDSEGPACRVEAVVDTSSGIARVVFWRELSHLGRGYPLSTLGTSAE